MNAKTGHNSFGSPVPLWKYREGASMHQNECDRGEQMRSFGLPSPLWKYREVTERGLNERGD